MKKLLNKIENYAIHKYGFENKKTIAVFKFTETLRNLTSVASSSDEPLLYVGYTPYYENEF